ncbi:hypothetical protein OG418_04390 [Streptomyces phaeochromogenes]
MISTFGIGIEVGVGVGVEVGVEVGVARCDSSVVSDEFVVQGP